MDKKDIAKELRKIKPNNNIRLPKSINFNLIDEILIISIENLNKNMQSDDNTFEGWALVLKSAFGNRINKVILDISSSADIDFEDGHCTRFLWRAHNFSRIFDWFEIGNCKDEVKNFVDSKLINVFLNIPKEDRNPVDNSDGERFVEYLFIDPNKSFGEDLRKLIDADQILNQIPVGLFQNDKKKIFPGKSSAIDLLGFKATDTLHLIELKIKDNNKVGIISEFLFYAFIMHNLFIKKDSQLEENFQYPNVQFPPSFIKYYELYKKGNVNRIDGYLLCEKYHPLVDYNAIILLNTGLSKFNINLNRLEYEYNYDVNNPVISNLKKV